MLHQGRGCCAGHEGLNDEAVEASRAALALEPDNQKLVIKAFPLLLLRGTALERDRDRWGFVDGGGAMPTVVESASFDQADWLAMARLSEALCLTEGRHPTRVDDLRRLAAEIEPTLVRWQPAESRRAA